MKIHNAMKTEIDAVDLIYDEENNRFVIRTIDTPFLVRLLFLITNVHLFVIKNASIMKHKLKNEDEETSES